MKKLIINTLIIIIFPFFLSIAVAQSDGLQQKIGEIISSKKAIVGVAVSGMETQESFSINGDKHFPMQSVFKFHIALAVLNLVDKGELTLEQEILIQKKDLLADTWSPMQKEYPKGNIKLKLKEILGYTISKSDNNGCDILLRLIGGPKKVEKFINSIGIKNISIKANEEQMHKSWNIQFKNWTTPLTMVELLDKFYNRGILSKKSTDFLLKIMIETSTGKNRIKGNLPESIEVAHKTGSSGTNDNGITAALNDIGIVTLPDGKHFSICVFVSNSKEDEETNEKIIADIAKAAWDYFTAKTK